MDELRCSNRDDLPLPVSKLGGNREYVLVDGGEVDGEEVYWRIAIVVEG